LRIHDDRGIEVAVVALLAVFVGEQTVSAVAQTKPADRLKAIEFIYPQWQGGRNNDAIERGLESVPPARRAH
jgi:hypothetical protein